MMPNTCDCLEDAMMLVALLADLGEADYSKPPETRDAIIKKLKEKGESASKTCHFDLERGKAPMVRNLSFEQVLAEARATERGQPCSQTTSGMASS